MLLEAVSIYASFVRFHSSLDAPHLLQQLLFADEALPVQDVYQRIGLDDLGHEQFLKFDQLLLVKFLRHDYFTFNMYVLISAAQWPHLMALASNSLPQLGHL